MLALSFIIVCLMSFGLLGLSLWNGALLSPLWPILFVGVGLLFVYVFVANWAFLVILVCYKKSEEVTSQKIRSFLRFSFGRSIKKFKVFTLQETPFEEPFFLRMRPWEMSHLFIPLKAHETLNERRLRGVSLRARRLSKYETMIFLFYFSAWIFTQKRPKGGVTFFFHTFQGIMKRHESSMDRRGVQGMDQGLFDGTTEERDLLESEHFISKQKKDGEQSKRMNSL